MKQLEVIKALMVTAELFGKDITEAAATMLLSDLDGYRDQDVLDSLAKCRRELRTFPTVSDIVSRISDGRPGVEEAWALLPKDEASTVVWTFEMRDAFNVARPLLATDEIAARQAFKEVYLKRVQEARERRLPPQWEPSLGFDKDLQRLTLEDAVRKGRLAQGHAQALLPDMMPTRAVPLLAGPVEDSKPIDIAGLLKTITKDEPIEKRLAATRTEAAREMTEEEIAKRKQELLEQAKRIEGEVKNEAAQ